MFDGAAKDHEEAMEFLDAFKAVRAHQGILITSHLLDLSVTAEEAFSQAIEIDSSAHGDILANRWKVYPFGSFDVNRLRVSLPNLPPTSFAMRYRANGFDVLPDGDGFVQVHDIPTCVGKEVHVCDQQGNWHFSQESLYPGMPHKNSLHTARRWPLAAPTGVVPSIGERLSILGGLSVFYTIPLADDSFTNDALWRMTPSIIWQQVLIVATNAPPVEEVDTDEIHVPQYHTGSWRNEREHRARARRKRPLNWRMRSRQPDVYALTRVAWPNVRQPRRLSLELGPRGVVGGTTVSLNDRYPGSSALSDACSIDDEDFTGNFTWPDRPDQRYSPQDLGPLLSKDRWVSTRPTFSYKKLWYAEQAFLTGLYGFHFEGYFYEALRMVANNQLDFCHLEAPFWFIRSVLGHVCQRRDCNHTFVMATNYDETGFHTFRSLSDALSACMDPHVTAFNQWMMSGAGYRISSQAWSLDARVGRFEWDHDAKQYQHADTPWTLTTYDDPRGYTDRRPRRNFTTGGMPSEFDRRMALMLETEKVQLITTGICDKTRGQYLSCWRRWAQYASCVGVSRWIKSFNPGRGNALLDFLVWQHKILGHQHIALAKGFYSIRYIHLVECFEDLSVRAHRVRCLLKAVKLRGKVCKKIPFTTDLIRWVGNQLHTESTLGNQIAIDQLWRGVNVAFFFCLRISELLALTHTDIHTNQDGAIPTLSIIIRGSETDQEHAGATRTLRANTTDICPVYATIRYLTSLVVCGPSRKIFPPSFRTRLTQCVKWAALAHRIPVQVINTHSLRAGGATALFVSGGNWIAIQRWGRWKSCISHEYIWEDNAGFIHLGERIASTHGHTDFMVGIAPQHIRRPTSHMPLFRTGSSGRPPKVFRWDLI